MRYNKKRLIIAQKVTSKKCYSTISTLASLDPQEALPLIEITVICGLHEYLD